MPHPNIQVTKFTLGTGRKLKLTFSDGTSGTVDMREYLDSPRFSKLFAPLADMKEFKKAYLDGGTVCWPVGLDVAPEALYASAHALPKPKTFEQAKANELAVSLRELRASVGLTQVKLAKLLGVSQPELSQYEAGRDDGRISTLRKYIEATGWKMEITAVRDGKRVPLRGI